MQNHTRPDYQSYLLRLRRADNAGWPNWWVSLESTLTGEHRNFADLEALFLFLRMRSQGEESADTRQTAVALAESLQAGSSQASYHMARLLQAQGNQALQPLMSQMAQRLGLPPEQVQQALMDAADEYNPGGNGKDPTTPSAQPELEKLQLAQEELRRHNRELAVFTRVTQALTLSLELDPVLTALLREMHRLANVLVCSIWLVDPETGELVCRQATGPGSETARGWRLAPGEGIAGRTLSSQQSIIVADVHADEHHHPGLDQETGLSVRSLLAVPLQVRGKTIGVLEAAAAEPNRFDDVDLAMLQSLAAAASIAIHNADLMDTLRVRNDELDAFAHTVAHDLKNPLSVLMGYSAMLQEELGESQNQIVQQSVEALAQLGRRMNTIIDELLLLASVRKLDQVALEPLDMAIWVTGALDRLYPMAEPVIVTAPSQWPAALGYGPWVEEVWVNYLSNAIKYGGRPDLGRAPRLELGAELIPPLSSLAGKKPSGEMIRFWVRDNGPGLTAEQQEQLFTEFTRLHQGQAKGHGLGLSIVRRIVEKLGGQVGVESQPGQGSRFWFTLPAAPGKELPVSQLVWKQPPVETGQAIKSH